MSYTINTGSLFGQPLVTYSGLASGLNTGAIVSAYTAAASQNQVLLAASAAVDAAKAGLYANMGQALGGLDDTVSGLYAAGVFATSTGTTSNSSAVAITTAANAQVGTYNVTVSQLAKAQLNTTANFTSASSTVLATGIPPIVSGSVSIAVGSGPATTFALTSITTLSQLAQSINSSGLAVKATIVNDANGYRINLQSNNTGVNSALTITENNSKTNFTGNQLQAAANAKGTVNGSGFDVQSNVSNSLISGVTMSFAALTGSPVTITVFKDLGNLNNTVQTFVLKYNAAIQAINTAFSSDQGTGSSELASDPGLNSVYNKLSNIIQSSPKSATGIYQELSDIGITQNDDGTLSINQPVLTAAIANDASSVANLIGDTSTGAGIASQVDAIASAFGGPAGALMSMSTARTAVATVDQNTAAAMQYAIDAQAATMQSNFVRYEVSMSELAVQNLIVEALANSTNAANASSNITPASASTSDGSNGNTDALFASLTQPGSNSAA